MGLVATLFVIDLVRRRRDAPDAPPRRAMAVSFAAPALVVGSVCALRWSLSGHVLSPWAKPLTHFETWPVAESLLYLRDYFTSTVAAALIGIGLGFGGLGVAGVGLPSLLMIFGAISVVSAIVLRRALGIRRGQVKVWDRDINE